MPLLNVIQVIEIKKGDFKWSKTALEPTLQHVDLTVRKGELVGVLGRVGCGKVCALGSTNLPTS